MSLRFLYEKRSGLSAKKIQREEDFSRQNNLSLQTTVVLTRRSFVDAVFICSRPSPIGVLERFVVGGRPSALKIPSNNVILFSIIIIN